MNIEKEGSHFVTRLKETSLPENVRKKMNTKKIEVLYDGLYLPSDISMRRRKVPKDDRASIQYRLIIYHDPSAGKVFYFVTSDFKLAATTIQVFIKSAGPSSFAFVGLKDILIFED